MMNEDKIKYTDMINESFDDAEQITKEGRAYLTAMMYNIDKLAEGHNQITNLLGRVSAFLKGFRIS